jgi:hypothetical protein
MIYKNSKRLRFKHAFILAIAAFAMIAEPFMMATPASAALSEGPNPADFSKGNSIYLLVANAGGVSKIDSNYSEVNIYIRPSYFAANTSATLRISNIDHCLNSAYSSPAGQPGGAYTPDTPGVPKGVAKSTNYSVRPWNAAETSLGAIMDSDSGQVISSSNNAGANTCAARYRDLALPRSRMAPATDPAHVGWYVAKFTAFYTASDGWNSFQLDVLGGTAAGYIGYYAQNAGGVKFALRQGRASNTTTAGLCPAGVYYNNAYYSCYRIPFAPDCGVTTPQPLSKYPLQIYDDDQGVSYQAGTLTYRLLEYAPGVATPKVIKSGSPPRSPTGEGRTYTVNDANVYLRPGYRYIWEWNNVNMLNALQFKIPFDSIYYALQCPQSEVLTPAVSVDKTEVEEGEPVTFTYKISRSALTSVSNGTCQLVASAGTTKPPVNTEVCQAMNAAGSGTFTIPANDANGLNATLAIPALTSAMTTNGRLCHRLTITAIAPDKPTTPDSDEACVSITKQPLVHFNGGDVWAGGSYKSAAGVCSANAANIQANARTLPAGADVGSHVEYGAFALGNMYGFGAGARPHTANGDGITADPSEYLAFANFSVSDPTQYILGNLGESAHCITDLGSQYAGVAVSAQPAAITASALPNGATHVVGDKTLNATTINANQRIVLYVEGNVTIAGDIAYTAGALASVAQIPSLNIIATGDITVLNNVRSLAGIYSTKGTFRTCEVTTGLTIATCNQQLNINGAVIAKGATLSRTGGTTNSLVVSQQAAERFNLMPDAFISTYDTSAQQLQARTVQQIDLPPRY